MLKVSFHNTVHGVKAKDEKVTTNYNTDQSYPKRERRRKCTKGIHTKLFKRDSIEASRYD